MDIGSTRALIAAFEKNTDCSIAMVDEYKQELINAISIPKTSVYVIDLSTEARDFMDATVFFMQQLENGKVLEQPEQGEGTLFVKLFIFIVQIRGDSARNNRIPAALRGK